MGGIRVGSDRSFLRLFLSRMTLLQGEMIPRRAGVTRSGAGVRLIRAGAGLRATGAWLRRGGVPLPGIALEPKNVIGTTNGHEQTRMGEEVTQGVSFTRRVGAPDSFRFVFTRGFDLSHRGI